MSVSESNAGGVRTISYGPDPAQVGDLYLPPGNGPFPLVVLVHGRWWTALVDRRQVAPLAEDLRRGGYAVWNIDYRTVGLPGGGWPGTFLDVAAAVDLVGGLDPAIDTEQVVTVGHSAGGHLAVWAASRPDLPKQAPGYAPRILPIAAVSLAGVLDLVAADADRGGAGLGDPAAAEPAGQPPADRPDLWPRVAELVGDGVLPVLLGGHAAEMPERYAWTSPTMLSSGTVPVLATHGVDDDVLPIRYGRNYRTAATARREPVEFREIPAAHHFDLVDPEHPSWARTLDWIAERISGRAGAPITPSRG
ncbi:MAG TPA: alpha/beta hydrolase [Pseudonocardiaceae bacterium]|jgi:acetyl esterase/lipase|nr:alpha/beta hydrolase [Pseudonocardiaceae bacterium]